MYGGFSGSQGILLYNTKKTGANGVYGYYDNEEIILIEGPYKELETQQKLREESYKKGTGATKRDMLVLFLVDIILIVTVFAMGRFLDGIAVLAFSVGSYFPLLILRASRRNAYKTKALFEQFRRFHGCEHQTISWLTKAEKSDVLTEEELRKRRIYDTECGTAYAGYWLTLTMMLTIVIVNLPVLGFLKSVGILLLTIAVLLVNIFNPYNPFLLIQRPVVAQPEEREYRLALAVAERLRQL